MMAPAHPPVTASLRTEGPRVELWQRLLGTTTVPLVLPEPVLVGSPQGPLLVFALDLSRLTAEQYERVVEELATRHGWTPARAAAALATEGMPVLAEDLLLTEVDAGALDSAFQASMSRLFEEDEPFTVHLQAGLAWQVLLLVQIGLHFAPGDSFEWVRPALDTLLQRLAGEDPVLREAAGRAWGPALRGARLCVEGPGVVSRRQVLAVQDLATGLDELIDAAPTTAQHKVCAIIEALYRLGTRHGLHAEQLAAAFRSVMPEAPEQGDQRSSA